MTEKERVTENKKEAFITALIGIAGGLFVLWLVLAMAHEFAQVMG